jgi:hypothetical protein
VFAEIIAAVADYEQSNRTHRRAADMVGDSIGSNAVSTGFWSG